MATADELMSSVIDAGSKVKATCDDDNMQLPRFSIALPPSQRLAASPAATPFLTWQGLYNQIKAGSATTTRLACSAWRGNASNAAGWGRQVFFV
jgi:hypothetical protein